MLFPVDMSYHRKKAVLKAENQWFHVKTILKSMRLWPTNLNGKIILGFSLKYKNLIYASFGLRKRDSKVTLVSTLRIVALGLESDHH